MLLLVRELGIGPSLEHSWLRSFHILRQYQLVSQSGKLCSQDNQSHQVVGW
jgi:hypothetical protein